MCAQPASQCSGGCRTPHLPGPHACLVHDMIWIRMAAQSGSLLMSGCVAADEWVCGSCAAGVLPSNSWCACVTPLVRYMYTGAVHVHWCGTCTLVRHMYTGAAHVHWCGTCTLVRYMYTGAVHVHWCGTCTLVRTSACMCVCEPLVLDHVPDYMQ
jgi:hypothetical protein